MQLTDHIKIQSQIYDNRNKKNIQRRRSISGCAEKRVVKVVKKNKRKSKQDDSEITDGIVHDLRRSLCQLQDGHKKENSKDTDTEGGGHSKSQREKMLCTEFCAKRAGLSSYGRKN